MLAILYRIFYDTCLLAWALVLPVTPWLLVFHFITKDEFAKILIAWLASFIFGSPACWMPSPVTNDKDGNIIYLRNIFFKTKRLNRKTDSVYNRLKKI